jgi:hypothetical protein
MAGLVALLGLLSLAVFVVGLVALARGHLDWARIRSRGRAGAVTAAALVVFVVCGALTPDDADAGRVAVKAAPLPAAASPGVEPTQTPRAASATATAPPAVAASPTATPTAVATVTPAAAVASSPLWPRSTGPAAQTAVGGPRAAPAPATAAPPPFSQVNPRAGCDPSYPDVCLHDGVGDYDCAGGGGNGPNYVRGPLRVLQPDPFDLDHDGNGTGCES